MAPKPIKYDAVTVDAIKQLRDKGYGWPAVAELLEGNSEWRTVKRAYLRGACVDGTRPTIKAPTRPPAMSSPHAVAVTSQATEAPPPLDPTNQEILKLERKLTIANQDIGTLRAKLNKSHTEGALYELAAEAIREYTTPLEGIKVKAQPSGSGDNEFDLVILVSDEHADQQISAAGTWGLEYFNFRVFRCRLQRLLQQAINHVTIYLPAHKFHRCWVLKLGDAVNGDIHGHGPRNYFGNTVKAALATGDTEAQFIAALVPYFPGGVHVVAVSGNHPRRSAKKDFDGPQDNFDYLVATQIATRLQKIRDAGQVSIHVPDSWTAFVEIRGRIWALNHGDDVVGFAGIPWYGFDRKNNRVQALVASFDQRIDYFCYGHYHTALSFPSGGAQSLHNGAFPMTDPYALEHVAVGKPPKQMIYTVNDERGITLPIPIDLRDPKIEQAFRRGEYEPELGKGLIIDQVTTPSTEGKFDIYRAP